MRTHLSWILAGLAACWGLGQALASAWVCDDAFISFRYADNLVEGLGLVYNAGERVEGYTNFLWVMLLAGGIQLGGEPILCSQYLGLLFYVATLVLLGWAAWRTGCHPVAVIGVGLHTHLGWFATCGLETSMFTFFVTLGLVALLSGETKRHFALAGSALILATMSRPDGAVFYVLAGGVALHRSIRQRRAGPLVAFAAPFALVYLPYFAWKWQYYGYPLPNTFYAKSASRPFVDQGLAYLRLYFSCYWYLIPALVLPAWLCWSRRGTVAVREPLLVALFTLPFLAYVAWVGGDFMFSRFCLPVTPALLLGLQLLARGRPGPVVAVGVLAASLVTSLLVYPFYTRHQMKEPSPVVEEREHYPKWYVDANRILGRRLAELFRGRDLRVVIGGAQAMLGYFGRFSRVVEMHGLTDEFIAHREIEGRGRIGHEKALPLDHPYYRERGIHMIVGSYRQVPVPNDRLADLRRFEFHVENVPYQEQVVSVFAQATLLLYDTALMSPLIGAAGVRFTPFPEHLDRYLDTMEKLGPEVVARDFAAFRAFYFDHNDDPERFARIDGYLRRFR